MVRQDMPLVRSLFTDEAESNPYAGLAGTVSRSRSIRPDQALMPAPGARARHDAGDALSPHLADQVRCDLYH